MLVPEAAAAGDQVCFLLKDPTVRYVLRPKEDVVDPGSIACKIREEFDANRSISHFEFVDECFVDGWMFGRKEKWLLVEEGSKNVQILALHWLWNSQMSSSSRALECVKCEPAPGRLFHSSSRISFPVIHIPFVHLLSILSLLIHRNILQDSASFYPFLTDALRI
jgi:hypothetical protein